ncbi:hypothetical protein [Nonomuraea jabiensis]|uniref:hypothetical protein n=1 Tax=Nonomuraea jabiensis TaxID=882448 RepID=UPI003D73BD7E
MDTVLDWIAWAEARPVTAAVIGLLGLVGLVVAVRAWRTAKRLIGMAWRTYVAPRPVEDVLTVVAASIATGVSAQGMWRFSGDVLGLDGPLRVLLFAFVEVAIVTSAVRARRNMRENFAAGLDGIAVWALTCLTAVLSSMDAQTLPEAVFRLAAPLVAAWLWERGMAIERHRIRGTGRINWRITPERLMVRIGLAETKDRTAQEVDAHRRLTRVALAAKRAKMLRESGASARKLRAALAKLDKAMDAAVEHTGLAVDQERQETLLSQIAAIYNTAALVDAEPVPPWKSKKETPVPSEAIEAMKAIARAQGRAEAGRLMPVVPPLVVLPQQRTADLSAGPSVPAQPDGDDHLETRGRTVNGARPFAAVPVFPSGTEPVSSSARDRDGTGTNTASSPSNPGDETGDRPRQQEGTKRRTKEGTVPRVRKGRARGRTAARPPEWDSVDELMPLGWRIVADLHKAGTALTRDTLRDAIRTAGTKVSTQRVTVLLQRLRAEAPAEPPMRTEDGDRAQETTGPSPVPGGDETGTNDPSSPPARGDETGTKARPVLTEDTTDDTHGETA